MCGTEPGNFGVFANPGVVNVRTKLHCCIPRELEKWLSVRVQEPVNFTPKAGSVSSLETGPLWGPHDSEPQGASYSTQLHLSFYRQPRERKMFAQGGTTELGPYLWALEGSGHILKLPDFSANASPSPPELDSNSPLTFYEAQEGVPVSKGASLHSSEALSR